MSIFEFLMVLVSLIIGLGIAEILTGIASAIRSRKTINFYWVQAVLVTIVFLALLQQWWEAWALNTVEVWSFHGLLMMISGPIGLFLISHLLFPDKTEGADLKAYYYNNLSAGYWLAVMTVIIASSFRPIIFGHNPFDVANLTSFVLVGIFATLALTRKEIVHAILVTLVLGLVLLDISLSAIEIQQ